MSAGLRKTDMETTVQPRLPALTSLRFLAALHVVMFHLHALKIYEGSGWYHRTALIGYVGVSLFYVLSGFILVYTYGGREMNVHQKTTEPALLSLTEVAKAVAQKRGEPKP